mmetsp:Transcript_20195/g.42079  ORF Transcript_20195/g.42079 Transcript_20195/m.42079 type:complete len:726 (-) Transcript_20195:42-2219(-)
MKFGRYLKMNMDPNIPPTSYLSYDALKSIIKRLTAKQLAPTHNTSSREVSLTMPPPTNRLGAPITDLKGGMDDITQEAFFTAIDDELKKIEEYTKGRVGAIRRGLKSVRTAMQEGGLVSGVKEQVDGIGADFLSLEKYVNLNFTGFHKILKKHDKNLPNPCLSFYVARMHQQGWVRGDYSDIVVGLSALYGEIRGDGEAKEKDESKQAFMRSTTKYWVNTADISEVKYAVLQHLPVFLQKTASGETDSQLTNSVYLDNSSLELYHGRLDKTPGAIAVRLRWYGNGDPETIFVERKTHRDAWTGEVSVKERFIIKEDEVESIMNGTYDIEAERAKLVAAGKSEKDVKEWYELASEITQAINTKLLVPTMRTQYMRTAFQIPFDATVRVSLDTNLCMISERGYDLEGGKRWHRDPSQPIKNTEIARFPHAVLEVKLEVKEGSTVPQWVTDLQNSGMLYEVHKFSKFIHGCSTLLPEDVQSVPYWVDDSSIRESIVASGSSHILTDASESGGGAEFGSRAGAGPGANQIYPHLLPHGTSEDNASGKAIEARTSAQVIVGDPGKRVGATYQNPGMSYGADDGYDSEGGEGPASCWQGTCCAGYQETSAPTSIQKVEPKLFFANERTFLHWLHMGVVVSGVASGILAFSKKGSFGEWYGIMLLPISLGFVSYALHTLYWRSERIKLRVPGRWDNPMGPTILAAVLVVVFTLNFFIELYKVVQVDVGRGII